MSLAIEVCSLLIDIEAELRRLNLWQAEPPSPEALSSQEPFCLDTLEFQQWLQFVFLVRMREMIEHSQPLPTRCNIAPMAEEYFRNKSINTSVLITRIQQLDKLLNNNDQ